VQTRVWLLPYRARGQTTRCSSEPTSNPVDAPARDLWAFSGSGAYDGQAGATWTITGQVVNGSKS